MDDLTAKGFARALDRELVLDSRALASMAAYFKKRGFEMTPENQKQAMLPQGAEVVENLWGTAPGFDAALGGCRFFAMPGVPSEMMSMFREKVLPRILARKRRGPGH